MPVEVERFSIFYLEIDRTNKQIVFRLDRRTMGLLPQDRIKANFRKALQRLVDYRQGGFEIDGEEILKAIE